MVSEDSNIEFPVWDLSLNKPPGKIGNREWGVGSGEDRFSFVVTVIRAMGDCFERCN
jgi:hypothetical protein